MPEDPEWPQPPIWPEDVQLIRELLSAEEWERVSTRLVHVLPDGPLVAATTVLPSPARN